MRYKIKSRDGIPYDIYKKILSMTKEELVLFMLGQPITMTFSVGYGDWTAIVGHCEPEKQ